MKRCTQCGIEQPEEAFEMQPSRGRRRAECRSCRLIASREWRAKRRLNPPKTKIEIKRCTRCQEVKPVSEFSPSSLGYFHVRCKACEVAVHREKRQEQYRSDPTGHFYWPFVNEEGITVKRCISCHAEKPVSEFYTNGKINVKGATKGRKRPHSKCKDCEKAVNKERYEANPEKHIAAVMRSIRKYPDRQHARYKRWHTANHKRLIRYASEYNQVHQEERRTYNRSPRRRMLAGIWQKAHPEIAAEAQHRRRARKVNAPRIERIRRKVIIERDNWTCYLCEQICTPQNVTLDHVIPLFRGGTHTADNLRVACGSCNSRKGTKLLKDFLK